MSISNKINYRIKFINANPLYLFTLISSFSFSWIHNILLAKNSLYHFLFLFFFLYWQFLDFWSAINYLDLISLPTEYIYVYIFSDERVGVYKLGKELRRTWLACYSMFSWKEDKVETRIHRTSEIYVCVLRNALRRNDYLLHMHIVHEWVIYSSSLHGTRNAAFCNGL